MEHHFRLLNLQNGNEDNGNRMQHYLETHEEYFFVPPGQNNSPRDVKPKEVSI